MIGLAKKAGKVISGSDVCERAIKSNKAGIIIVSGDSSQGTLKKFNDMCSYRNVPLRVLGDRYSLGRCIGRDQIVVVGIIEEGFALVIQRLIDESLITGGEVNG